MFGKRSLPTIQTPLSVVFCLLLMANSAMGSGPQESTRYNFAGNGHATEPFDLDGLVADRAGNLYGTAEAGGEKGNGAIFEFVRPTAPGQQWTETILYSFQNESDGRYPMSGLVFDHAGNLHGTTAYGGPAESGSVFELSPPAVAGGAWTETTLHQFLRGNDGGVPVCASYWIAAAISMARPITADRQMRG